VYFFSSSSTIFTEPTDDWKVEQVLWWCLLRSQEENDGRYETIVSSLEKQLADGRKELWDAHQQVTDILNMNMNMNMTNTEEENVNPVNDEGETEVDGKTNSAAAAELTKTTSSVVDTIHVDVIDGPYAGNTYDLVPRKNRSHHVWIGRSAGKKFRSNGISLPKDLEVSTSHGRFEMSRGKFYFTDCASTNGSRIFGMDIEPNQPIEIYNDIQITVGQTVMKVTLTSSSSTIGMSLTE
jgi:hypothetical protein